MTTIGAVVSPSWFEFAPRSLRTSGLGSGTALVDPEHYNSSTDGHGVHKDVTEYSSWQWYPSNSEGSFETQPYGNWKDGEPNGAGGKVKPLLHPRPLPRKRSHIRVKSLCRRLA